MRFYRDTYSGQLWKAPTRAPVLRFDFVRGSVPQIIIQDVTDGIAVTPSNSAVYTLTFKVNKADGTALIPSVTGTLTGTTMVFKPTFSSGPLDTALAASDPVRVWGELKAYDGSNYTTDTEFPCYISGNTNRTGDTSPGVITSSTAIVLNNVTSLTGGTTYSLDSVPTAGLAAGNGLPYWVRISGVLKAFYLETGAADGTDPSQVAPLDYNSSTNSKRWIEGL